MVLQTKCRISEALDPDIDEQPQMPEFDAIWDTGATNCVITQTVVDTCGLVPTGRTRISGVDGVIETDTYLVNLILPNRVGVMGVRATKGNMVGIDLLIGMDVINRGDFAVTNLNGKTKFSFRFPSKAHIDFVEESNTKNRVQQFQHGGNKRSTNRQKPAKKGGRTK